MRTILKELSGQDQTGADVNASFLELGFDSLFLTQVAGAFRKEFGIKVTFRQLLEDYSTMDTLAGYLDAQLPVEVMQPAAVVVVTAATTPTPSTPVVTNHAPGGSVEGKDTLERVINEQLRVMAQQLEMLRGGSPAPVTAPITPAAASVPRAASLPNKSEPKAFGPYRPIDKAPGGGLTDQQREHLDALVARYSARTPQSKRCTQETRARLADPRTVSGFRQPWKEAVYPLIVERSAGCRFWDIDGNEYVDLTMGFGTNLLGHSPDFVTAALREQLERGVEVGPQTPVAGQVAALLCELTGTERAAFTNTGSEAILAAVRLARTVTGRTRIATCGGFHGINDEVLVRANVVDGQRRSMPVAPGIPDHIVRDVLVIDYGTAEGLELLRAHAHELAAVLVEPVQSRRPDLQPREFLHAVREITQQAGCALVFDEIINGFRCHLGGAQAYFGVRADIVTYGKIIGGGMPIGAVCGKAEYLDALDGGMWQYGDGSFPEVGVTFFAGTYIRHPLTMAASWAILNHLKREGEGLQRRLNERAAQAVGEINGFCQRVGVPLRLEHFSSFFLPHFDDDIKYGGLLFLHLRDKGVHIWEGRPCFFSTAHTDADIAFIIRAFKESITDLQTGGFLPGQPIQDVALNGQNGHAPSLTLERESVAEISEQPASPEIRPRADTKNPLQFSLYFFGNYPAAYDPDKYRLILEGARFADQHDFTAIWLPERHFHALGGFSPNPSLLAAALARDTERIALRGGSVVLPLHHPVRVAEEWSMVDNLSNGRVGMSIASGWHPNDFVFAPERFERRREICLEDIQTIQKLWRGESLPMRAGAGTDFEVKLHPLPVQAHLPVWFTCIQEESFARAGELGVGVLGYLMNQTVDELATKIRRYRKSLQERGHDPAKGHVTVLVHTFVGEDFATAREKARGPLKDYLRSYLDNSQKRLESQNGPVQVEEDDIDYLLEKSYADYVKGKALIGTPESCAAVADRLREIGVDEIGCFVDFGVDPDAVLNGLDSLNKLRERYARPMDRTLPLTDSQTGLWVLGQTDADALRTYNESTTLDLRGPLDVVCLERALNTTVNRHEALRVTISPDGETQTIHPAVVVELPLVDLSADVPAVRIQHLEESLLAFEQKQFDFERGPLLRAQLIKLAADHHILVLTFHHLVGNGPSYWVFLEELTAIYESGRGDSDATLEKPMQLGEYLHWRAGETAHGRSDDEHFWLGQFSGGLPVLELPTDRPRPTIRTHRGGRERIRLPKELTVALRKTAASQRGSLFMILLTAFEVLMHRLSNQDDIVVGTSFEGEVRSLPGGERLFANTTNVLPLPSRASDDTRFSDLLAATKNRVLEANEHQNYFFGQLIKKLKITHDPSRPAVFSVFFNYESGKFARELADGLRVELLTDDVPYRSPRDTAMFELYLNVAEKDGELLCECDYSASLFDGSTVQRWLGHYRTLLESVVSNPSEIIWRQPLMNVAEREKMIGEWNATAVDYPVQGDTLHSLFEAQVRRTPDAVAFIFENQQLTYGQLDLRANQLANALRTHGVEVETLVGICVERSLEMVVGLLGVLKAGAAYVPLDPDYPAERLAYMLADAKASVLLTQERLKEKLPASHGAKVVCLDADWNVIARESASSPEVNLQPENLAYVIYTSGSTGQPKGAMNTHQGIRNRLLWMQDTYRLGPQDRVLQKTPFSFDVSVWEFFWPLMTGAALVIARPRGHQDSSYLAQLVSETNVSVVHFVPPMLSVFLEERGLAEKCSSLRHVICSGEALSFDLQERFLEVFVGTAVKLHNLYGPTEAAVDVTYWECQPDGDGVVPIGRPIANTQVYVLDRRGQAAPVGVPGELHIGGLGVGRGYLGRPDLTGEKFIPDLFRDDPLARLYKTGDLVRWREDGSLIYLGRLDHQVKLRGFRIELGEIEAAINSRAEVRECIVVLREDVPGERRLVAYYVADSNDDLAGRLREHLKGVLPDYMVPAAFVSLKSLPLTPNGKVNRRALPAPDLTRSQRTSDADGVPMTTLEEYLSDVWREILGVATIGRSDDFFEIGGDSLSGLRIINRLRETFSEHISLVVMFEAPTISALAKLFETNYAMAVAKFTGDPETRATDVVPLRTSGSAINEDDVLKMREIIGHAKPPVAITRAEKNPSAVFILSPMRSGSTLLRIMLAGSPRLFSPPELQLLQFDTLAERRTAFKGYESYLLEGTVRALMELHQIDLPAAQKLMAAHEADGMNVTRFYREMQEAMAPRLLVDKTPDYAVDLNVLRRAENCFDEPLYVHLARHPLGMIRSYEQGRFLLESPYRGRHDFSARQMAELTWLVSHRNIIDFLREVPVARQHVVRFEDVVAAPEPTMKALGEFLGVGYDHGMVNPYGDGKMRMTDGVHEMSVQVGDANFYRHGTLKPEAADQWKTVYTEDFLSVSTWEVAAKFGYENPFAAKASAAPSNTIPSLPLITAVSRESRRVKRSTLARD